MSEIAKRPQKRTPSEERLPPSRTRDDLDDVSIPDASEHARRPATDEPIAMLEQRDEVWYCLTGPQVRERPKRRARRCFLTALVPQ